METTIRTDKIVIETRLLGENTDKKKLVEIRGQERIIMYNDEVIYKEYIRYNDVNKRSNIAQYLNQFENELFFGQQSKSTYQSSSNRRNLIEFIKMVWSKLFS